jgi:hypothetical protein
MTHNRESKLFSCFDNESVELILNDLNITREFSGRMDYLFEQMGITQSFTCNEGIYKIEDGYKDARSLLVSSNKERVAKERAKALTITAL